MLQAIDEQGKQIIPSLLTKREITELRKCTFYCPQCHEEVIIRAGPKVIPHFAHHPKSTCIISSSGESSYHKLAKVTIFNWLKKQHMNATLEKYLNVINRRPDLFIERAKQNIVIEFQSATISATELAKRNESFKKLNIIPIWILGNNQLKHTSPFTYRISYPFHELLHDKVETTRLIYFCPYKQLFTVLNDLYFSNLHHAVAHSRIVSINDIKFSDLFKANYLSQRQLYKIWYDKKKTFRLSTYKVYGRELQYRKWLYYKGLHVEQLPSIIHLPIRSQYKMNIPIWHWQSKLVLNILEPLKKGTKVCVNRSMKEILPYVNKRFIHDVKEIIEQYFSLLEKAKIIKKLNQEDWVKNRDIRYHRYIEQSLKADQLLMDYLSE